MNTVREPPKPGIILATPLNVEESREQRQQRSQARFRDRGGIFVPSNRNLLADILLGKAAPLKKPRRSVSASPSRKSFGKATSESLTKSTYEDLLIREEHSDATLRRSPRKPGRKSTHDDDEPTAAPSSIEHKTKPIKKPTTQKDPPNSKASAKSKTTKSSSRSTPSKASTARKNLNDISEDEEDVIDNTAISSKVKNSKSKPRAAAPVERTKTKAPTFPPPAASSQPIATASTITSSTQRIRPQPRKSHSDLYSGASEDEYTPPVKKTAPRKSRAKQTGRGNGTVSKPTKKAAGSNKQKAHPQLADIPEEDEEEEEDGGNQSQSAKKSVTHSSKGKGSTKPVLPDTPEQQRQPASVNEPVQKQPTSSKKAKTTKAKAKAKTAEKAPAAARGKQRAVQEEEAEEDLPQPKQVAKKSASGKGKKRTAQEDKLSEDISQPPQKRAKQEEAKKSNGEKSTNKKRPREEDVQDEADVYEKETKRKKSSKDANSKSEVPAKKVPKGAKSKAGTKAVAAKKARKPTSTAKRKENSLPPEETQTKDKPVENRRPPKSVLIRIMNLNALPLVADNEPDEIDFLS